MSGFDLGEVMRSVVGLLSVAMLSPLMAAETTDIDVSAGVEYFIWEEVSDSGSHLRDEAGPRYFVGIVGTNYISPGWSTDFGGKVYSGTVDYDSKSTAGIETAGETDYNGYRLELGFIHDIGHRRKLKAGEWLIRFALGIDHWRRRVQDSLLADGATVDGFLQRYTSRYASLGASYRQFDSWAFGFGARAPINNSAELENGDNTTTVHPEGQLSLFASAEFAVAPGWAMALDYDSLRFAKSDEEEGVYQPQSAQDTIGATLHYRF